MIGTALAGRGGISSVIGIYRAAGFFETWRVTYISSHCEGSFLKKVVVALQGFRAFFRLARSGHVGLVHLHTASDASFWRKSIFILLAKAFGLPVILHVHGGGFDIFFKERCNSIQRYLIRRVMRKCDCIVALSAQWVVRLRSISGHSNIVTVVNPVVLPVPKEEEHSIRRHSDILFLGRIDRMKGVFDLLEALVVLKHEFPAIRLLCGGDGNTDEFLSVASQLGVRDCVKLLGWVTQDIKAKYLAESTVFALPSYAEGMPMGVLEAMAAGLPIVASTVGGIPDTLKDGVEGFLISPGDVQGLIQALRCTLSNVGLQQSMGKAGRHRVEAEFAVSKVIERMNQVYCSLGAAPNQLGS